MAVTRIDESKLPKKSRKVKTESVKTEAVAPNDWEVKQVRFDVAVPAGTDLYCQAMSGNTEFYKALSKLLNSFGFEMAGDIIDTEDMTDVYKSNDYEFFTECASLKEGVDVNKVNEEVESFKEEYPEYTDEHVSEYVAILDDFTSAEKKLFMSKLGY